MALDLDQPWILLVVAGGFVAAVVAGLLIGGIGRGSRAPGALVARAERLRALPSVRRATRRRIVALSGLVLLGAGAAGAAGLVAAKPMAEQTIVPENRSRDVMLCLDVSGSMTDVDIEVVKVFEELLEGFAGERIGLTIFNASSVQIFPLTDDYEFVRTHLESLRESFENYSEMPEHWIGTLDGPGSSLIGDGLASCAMRFDHADEERSRSIILATDNEEEGHAIVTLDEAAAYTAEHGIRVFALNPIAEEDDPIAAELVRAAETTDGRAYALRGDTTVGEIVHDVQQQEARALVGQAQIVRTDEPTPWIIVTIVVAFGAIATGWAVRL